MVTKEKERDGRYAALAVCMGGLLLGALGGCLLAALMNEEGKLAFSRFFTGYGAALAAGAGVPELAALLWDLAKWPLAVFLLGFSSLAVAAVPLLFGLRGFLVSYCVAALIRAMAGRGALLALVLFGVESLFCLPVLLLLGLQSWMAGRALKGHLFYTKRLKNPYTAPYWLRVCLCAAVLVLGALMESVVLPPLLRAIVLPLQG